MNWQFVIMQAVVLLGILAFMLAMVYYIRHRHTRALATVGNAAPIPEEGGLFLKRYVPPELREAQQRKARKSLFASRSLFYFSTLLVPSVFISLIGITYYLNRSEFLVPIDLTEQDMLTIDTIDHDFETTVLEFAPTLAAVVDNTSPETEFVFYNYQSDDDYLIHDWREFLDSLGLSTRTCTAEQYRRCRLSENSIAVVALEHSPEQLPRHVLNHGASLWSYGFPAEIREEYRDIPGLSFQSSPAAPGVTNLALIGDRELSLGIDAGLHLPIGRERENVRVISDNPQAISMFSDGKAGGTIEARMHAASLGTSRIVWTDFPLAELVYTNGPVRESMDSLSAAHLRFLTRQRVETITTWPASYRYAAFIEQDTEEGFQNSNRVSNFFEANGYPVTWFALSNLGQKYRDVSNRLARSGELSCHGDNHDIFPRYTLEQQTQRIARCIKVFENVTGERPLGFRPPTEAFNQHTLSAALNAGINHIYAENTNDAMVPHLKISKTDGRSLVSLPRVITDDYYLWSQLDLDPIQSLSRMHDELAWVRTGGVTFGFSFHTQYMADEGNFSVVKNLAHAVGKDDEAWMTTAGEIARWWRLRRELQLGRDVPAELIQQFNVQKIGLNEDGQLYREPYAATYASLPVQ